MFAVTKESQRRKIIFFDIILIYKSELPINYVKIFPVVNQNFILNY